MRLAINADMGESWGAFRMGNDSALIRSVQSVSIACGLHAGDPLIMSRTVALARTHGVSVGAHPGYADLHGFGRRPMALGPDEIRALVQYQIGALSALAGASGWPLTHVKPHGALNNQACTDRSLAVALVEAFKELDPDLILIAPAHGELARAGDACGLRVALEIYADRSYEPDGQLTPRSVPGSVVDDPEQACRQVLRMIDAGGILARDGTVLKTPFHTICVHGDSLAAVETAGLLAGMLTSAGCSLCSIPEVFGTNSDPGVTVRTDTGGDRVPVLPSGPSRNR